MTDETNLVSESSSQVQSESNVTNSSGPEATAPEAATPEADRAPNSHVRSDRRFTRDELAKITNAEVQKATTKAKQEAIEEFKRQQQEQSPAVQEKAQNVLSDEELEQRIDRLAQKKHIDAQLHSEAQSFTKKLDLENDPEMKLCFEKLKMGKLKMPFVHILNSVDNSKEVVKEFAKFPEKLVSILNTANLFGIDAGKEAMQRASESIKRNQAAASIKVPNDPISQIGPSNASVDNSQLTAADYRKMYAGRY